MDKNINPFTFSTVACPNWTIEQVLNAANEYGYQGVELRTLGAGSATLASDPALTDPEKIRNLFDNAKIKISCLATSVALHYKKSTEIQQAIAAAKTYIDLANQLGCPRIRTFGNHIFPGETKYTGIKRVANNYTLLADYAEENDIEIVIENSGSFSRAKELWQLLNYVNHPLVGVAWNVANAGTVGEGPGISVPNLNSLIRYAKFKDTVIGEGTGFVQLGEGDIEVERFLELLIGIGYTGWLCVEWDKAWLPNLAEPQDILPQAREILYEYLRPRLDKKGNQLSKREGLVLEVPAK